VGLEVELPDATSGHRLGSSSNLIGSVLEFVLMIVNLDCGTATDHHPGLTLRDDQIVLFHLIIVIDLNEVVDAFFV
jgi:hypothetical protein